MKNITDYLTKLFKEYFNCITARNRIPVGLHVNVKETHIDVDIPLSKLDILLSRTRDTWLELGNSEPYWSVLVHSDYKRANIDRNFDRFYETGRSDRDTINSTLARNRIFLSEHSRCVDFGCGVGRLSLAFAENIQEVEGIDFSSAHCEIADQAAGRFGIRNAKFTTISRIEDIDGIQPFDLLISLIVLQHNPPPVMKALLEKLLERLAVGGVAIFQLPTFISGYEFSIDRYLEKPRSRDMEMHALPQIYVFDVIARCGCRLIEVREDTKTGSADMVSQTFVVRK